MFKIIAEISLVQPYWSAEFLRKVARSVKYLELVLSKFHPPEQVYSTVFTISLYKVEKKSLLV